MAHAKISRLQETQKSDKKIGRLIATVLNHPDLPDGVYNAIGDALAELQSQPGHCTRPELIQAVIDTAKGRAAETKPAAEEDQRDRNLASADEPGLRLSMDQFQRLQKVWWAIGEISETVDAPENEGAGSNA